MSLSYLTGHSFKGVVILKEWLPAPFKAIHLCVEIFILAQTTSTKCWNRLSVNLSHCQRPHPFCLYRSYYGWC